jgi:hypothetical protein
MLRSDLLRDVLPIGEIINKTFKNSSEESKELRNIFIRHGLFLTSLYQHVIMDPK